MSVWPRSDAGARIAPALWVGAWMAGFALEAAAGSLVLWMAGEHGPALLAVLINLLVCARFAWTLRPGQVPLITRYARCDEAGLPRECEGYTRGVTAAWAALLAIFALIHAGAVPGFWTTRGAAFLQSAVCLAFFLGEHPLRARLFPQSGRVTPWRTLRAIKRSFGTRHAA